MQLASELHYCALIWQRLYWFHGICDIVDLIQLSATRISSIARVFKSVADFCVKFFYC